MKDIRNNKKLVGSCYTPHANITQLKKKESSSDNGPEYFVLSNFLSHWVGTTTVGVELGVDCAYDERVAKSYRNFLSFGAP